MKRILVAVVALVVAAALPALAGEWHSGGNNVCTDCHTMHFSMQHNWDGTTPVPTVPTVSAAGMSGNWLGASGPNQFLLKAPANQLCLTCHNGQTFAPDVFAVNTNAGSQPTGRSAGAVNDPTAGAPYDTYKGHTLGQTGNPPGYAAGATFYDAVAGLECISCHAQHGPPASYRNLGPYSMPDAGTSKVRPTYVISTTNDTTKDVWINIATGYQAGTGNAGTFAPFYDASNVSYNRNDAATVLNGGTAQLTSNRMDNFCGECHGQFHGGTGDANIGGGTLGATADGFVRHPTSQQVIGSATAGGHSSLTRYAANVTKVKVYANDRVGYTDATPGCVSCHKAHGNQSPFGLVFLNMNSTSGYGTGDGYESGGLATGETETLSYGKGYRNLCGQCHSQGANNLAPW
jgi:hypothetical protein